MCLLIALRRNSWVLDLMAVAGSCKEHHSGSNPYVGSLQWTSIKLILNRFAGWEAECHTPCRIGSPRTWSIFHKFLQKTLNDSSGWWIRDWILVIAHLYLLHLDSHITMHISCFLKPIWNMFGFFSLDCFRSSISSGSKKAMCICSVGFEQREASCLQTCSQTGAMVHGTLNLTKRGTNGKSFTFFVIVYIIIYIKIEGTYRWNNLLKNLYWCIGANFYRWQNILWDIL